MNAITRRDVMMYRERAEELVMGRKGTEFAACLSWEKAECAARTSRGSGPALRSIEA